MRILLINGWSAPNSVWDVFLETVSSLISDRGMEISAIDVIAIDRALSVEEWCDEIDVRVCDDTFLLGWSLGGMLATAYAARSTRKFAGLVTLMSNPSFIATEGCPWAMSSSEFDTFLGDLDSDTDGAAYIKEFTALMARGEAQQKTAIRFLREHYAKKPARERSVLAQSLSLLGSIDLTDQISRIQVPVLMLFGQHDVLSRCPSEAQIDKLGPLHAPVAVRLLSTGHLPFVGAIQEVQGALIDFMVTND